MQLRETGKKRSLILNMAPLIDVLFLLLIFFMVSTTFLSQPAFKLELPEAKNAENVRQSPIIVYVSSGGRVYLNDEPIETALLGEALRRRLLEADDKSVVLKADARVSHGAVIEILDIIKGTGVQKLVVPTTRSVESDDR